MTPEEHVAQAVTHIAAAIASTTAQPTPAKEFPPPLVELKPWCGKCDDPGYRNVRNADGAPTNRRCPDCHPFPNPRPSTRICQHCGVELRYSRSADEAGRWLDERDSVGCAYSPQRFEHQPK